MPFTSERLRPWSDLSTASSPERARTIFPPSTLAVTPPSRVRESSPFGPLTVSVAPETVAVTPVGSGTGIFPIRDMTSPDLAEDLAADALHARLAVGEDAVARREHGDAEAVEHLRELAHAAVRAAAGLAHAADRRDDGVAVDVVLQVDAQARAAVGALGGADVVDVALALEDVGHGAQEPRRAHVDHGRAHAQPVADPGEHVGDGVGHHRGSPPTTRPCGRRGSRLAAPWTGSKGGRCRTSGSTRDGGRRTDSGCSRASRTSA